jgi:hypothetical protein
MSAPPRASGGDSPRKPKVMDVLRERAETELDDWLRPFYEARDGGDPQLALKAAESVLDRVYAGPSRPARSAGLTGAFEAKRLREAV